MVRVAERATGMKGASRSSAWILDEELNLIDCTGATFVETVANLFKPGGDGAPGAVDMRGSISGAGEAFHCP
jgi:hypothetical protein